MDLATLNAFIAIAELGSFSEAAERLHLTQPAVSKRIASLELQLNVRLFDRLGREVSLTEAGRALLPRAYQILNVLDDTRRALTNLNGEISGRLTLATSHHIGLHRLPPLLRAFTRAHPQVALDIQFLDSEVAYEEVLHGRAELAVITLAPETREPVHAVAVWDDPLDFVAAPEHPLARSQTISLADVAQTLVPAMMGPTPDPQAQARAQACMGSVGRYSEAGARNTGSPVPRSGAPPLPTNPTTTFDSASIRIAESVIDVPLPSNRKIVLRSGTLKARLKPSAPSER